MQRPLAPKEFENFLKTAVVKSREPGPGGRTDAWRLSLESRGKVYPAVFRYVDRRRPDPLPDSYKYDLAAYALDKYLGLGLVPPIVERAIAETPGALQVFVGNAVSDPERREKHIPPEDPDYYERAMADLLVFQNLVYDDCRNEKDTLIGGADGRVYRIDFSEAFAPKKGDVPHCTVLEVHAEAGPEKLLAGEDRVIADSPWPVPESRRGRALNARRRIVVQLIKLLEIEASTGGPGPLLIARKGGAVARPLPARLPVPQALRRHPPRGRQRQGPPARPQHLRPAVRLLHPEAHPRRPHPDRPGRPASKAI